MKEKRHRLKIYKSDSQFSKDGKMVRPGMKFTGIHLLTPEFFITEDVLKSKFTQVYRPGDDSKLLGEIPTKTLFMKNSKVAILANAKEFNEFTGIKACCPDNEYMFITDYKTGHVHDSSSELNIKSLEDRIPLHMQRPFDAINFKEIRPKSLIMLNGTLPALQTPYGQNGYFFRNFGKEGVLSWVNRRGEFLGWTKTDEVRLPLLKGTFSFKKYLKDTQVEDTLSHQESMGIILQEVRKVLYKHVMEPGVMEL